MGQFMQQDYTIQPNRKTHGRSRFAAQSLHETVVTATSADSTL